MLEQLEAVWQNVLATLVGYGPRILGGLVILVVGWLFSLWATHTTRRIFEKSDRLDKTVEQYLTQLIRITVLIVAAIAALASFGVQTTSIIAVLGAMGLAVGLALQGTLSNVASGIVLLVLSPFRVDDWVEVGGASGKVTHVGLFATRLQTGDGLFVMLPNARIWGDKVVNFTRNETRRIEMVFRIAYDDDIGKATHLIQQVLAAEARVLDDPEPVVTVQDLGESSVDLLVWAWAARDDFFTTRADLVKETKERFGGEGITIPAPRREVRIVSDQKELTA